MQITRSILAHAASLSEGVPLSAGDLLHLGPRPRVSRALALLTARDALIRIYRGLYVLPVEGRFGRRPPSAERLVPAFAAAMGETIVPHGAAAANWLGLSTQVPVRYVFLTSGPNRVLTLGRQTVSLVHAPAWRLLFPHRTAGNMIRALDWMGEDWAVEAIPQLRRTFAAGELSELASVRSQLPAWLANVVDLLVE